MCKACSCSVGLAYEMMNSASSPWKPLICNFPSNYDNFLQMQDLDVLEQCSAEVSVVNPGFNATNKVRYEIMQSSVQLQGIVAAVIALFPKIFPTGLPAKYFMHARMAVLSRAWGSDGHSVLCPIADLFNHQEPTHTVISIRKSKAPKGKSGEGDLSVVEVILERTAEKDEEVFNGTSKPEFGFKPFHIGTVIFAFLNRTMQATRAKLASPVSFSILASFFYFMHFQRGSCKCFTRQGVTPIAGYAPMEARNNICRPGSY